MAIQKVSGVTIGLTNDAEGDIMFHNGTDWVRLAKGEPGEVLTVNEIGTLPVWGASTACEYAGHYGSRGVYGGFGDSPNSDRIAYINPQTLGNPTYFGDLTAGRSIMGAVSNVTRGVFGGGSDSVIPSGESGTIDYITIGTLGNATDFGDLTLARTTGAYLGNSCENVNAVGNCTRGVFGGGGSAPNTNPTAHINDILDYITIATPGNAIDFGDLTSPRYSVAACSNRESRGLFAGGWYSGGTGMIDYIDIDTLGNAADFGDLSAARAHANGTDSQSGRGIFVGGYIAINTIDFVTISTLGNAADFGDLTVARGYAGTLSDGSRGVFAGGSSGSNQTKDEMDYVEINTLGNAVDFGDLYDTSLGLAGLSGN